ncbi:SRPBCC family protein [Methyloparacoccus murrellii]
MKKFLPLFAASSLFWVGLADAHGPTREKLSEAVEVAASPDVVWALVGDFAHPEKWMPAVESTTAQGGNEKGATRELKLKPSGGVIKEELKNYDADKKVVQYKIIDPTDPAVLPVNNYSAKISVEASGSGTKVEWDAAFYRWFLNNNPPEGQNEAAAKAAIEKVVKESLANLKAVAEKH